MILRAVIAPAALVVALLAGCGRGADSNIGSPYIALPPAGPIFVPSPIPSPSPSLLPISSVTVAPGAYWVAHTSEYPEAVKWTSADSAGRTYVVQSSVGVTGFMASAVAIGVDAAGEVFVTDNSPASSTLKQIQVLPARATGFATPVRVIAVPHLAFEYLVESDGSLLVGYNGQVRKLSPNATDYSQGTPYANLWTRDTSSIAKLVPADGPLALGPDGTLYCLCDAFSTSAPGARPVLSISSYAPMISSANSAPTTIATIDPAGLYPAGYSLGWVVANHSLVVSGGLTYALVGGSVYLNDHTTAGPNTVVAVPLAANGNVVPATLAVGSRLFGIATDGANVGVQTDAGFTLLQGNQNGTTFSQITQTPAYVKI